jgi:hypothetical protein
MPLNNHPNWGGRRPGAGRPPILKKKRIGTSVTLSPALLQELDKLRGNMSRSAFIEQLLHKALANQRAEKP